VYKSEQKVAEYKKEEQVFELKREVIATYNRIIAGKEILRIRLDAVNATYVHVKMAEKEFSEGAISIGELSRVTEIHTKALTDKEEVLVELKNLYVQLEQICGKTF
jgi:outer membrane protein TolC